MAIPNPGVQKTDLLSRKERALRHVSLKRLRSHISAMLVTCTTVESLYMVTAGILGHAGLHGLPSDGVRIQPSWAGIKSTATV